MKIKRILCGVAMAAAVGVTAALSGCTIETKHPRAKITVEFNGQTYALEYTLYRNMYPQTVRHFIELAEAGFYNNTIIHDYQSGELFGGGYAYSAADYKAAYESGSMEDYFNDADYYLEDNYYTLFKDGDLTASVYTAYDYENNTVKSDSAYHTLIGEFSDNGHSVENGQRQYEFGSIRMYYTAKNITDTASATVYAKTGAGKIIQGNYKYNSATSLFAIRTSSSSASESAYCTFAYLRNDAAVDTFNNLLSDIADYIDDVYNGDSDDFVTEVSGIETDRYETIAEKATTDIVYDAPEQPIIIKSVKITKY